MEQFQFSKCLKTKKGQSLIELLVAMAIMAIIIPALAAGFIASREGRVQRKQRLVANPLLQGTIESVISLRNESWNTFATFADGTDYYPEISGTSFTLTSGQETINLNGIDYLRYVVIESVQRDALGNIVTSGGTNDPSTKKVTATISWDTPYASAITSSMYVTRHKNNAALSQSLASEFNLGTFTSTETSGDTVIFSASPTWAAPSLTYTYDNPDTADGNSVYVDNNRAYLATADGGSDPDLTILDVTTPSAPTVLGSIDLGVDVYDVEVSGNYAYLATESNSQEFMVIDVSNPASLAVAATVDLTDSQNLLTIAIDGSYAYGGRDDSRRIDEFVVIDISNPNSPSEVASLDTPGDANEIAVSGNYAYIASDDNDSELYIINISSPTSPSIAGNYDAPGNANVEGVYASGNTVYLSTASNSIGQEFYIIDASTPSSPSLTGSYEVGSIANDVFVDGDYAFLATTASGNQFLVVDISTPASPTQYGSYDIGDDANGVFISDPQAYIAGAPNTAELTILTGGGGLPYASSGTFETQTLDAGALAAFNYLSFDITEPASTNINFQFAIDTINPPTTFLGPDGTVSTYYEDPAMIPLTEIEGQYIRVKAFFTGDGNDTPVLNSIDINYSP